MDPPSLEARSAFELPESVELPADGDVPAAPAPPDGRSFSERYRGTEWGGSAPVTVPSPEAEGRRRGSRIFLVLGVALLAGTVLTALALDASGRLDLIPGLGPAPTDTLPRAPSETTDPVVAAATIDAFVSVVTSPSSATRSASAAASRPVPRPGSRC